MLMVQSATDASSVRPIVPPKFGSVIGSFVRSGLNLPIASASDAFSPRTRPSLPDCTTDFSRAPGMACSNASR